MKITKHRDDILKAQKDRKKANEGCDVCPCCGETRTMGFRDGRTFGIMHLDKTFFKGFFRPKRMSIDVYICKSCGAEWESDPYEYEV